MLYGCQNIHVYTDHLNNTFSKFRTQRVLRWRLFLEEYGVKLYYNKGEDNHLADALSRLPLAERQNPSPSPSSNVDNAPSVHDTSDSFVSLFSDASSPNHMEDNFHSNDVESDSFFSMACDEPSLLDCFVNLPASEDIPNVLQYATMRDAQPGDAQLQALPSGETTKFQ